MPTPPTASHRCQLSSFSSLPPSDSLFFVDTIFPFIPCAFNDFRVLLKLNEYEIDTTQQSVAQCNRYNCFVWAIRVCRTLKKKIRHQLKNIIERFVDKSQLKSIFHLDLLIRQWKSEIKGRTAATGGQQIWCGWGSEISSFVKMVFFSTSLSQHSAHLACFCIARQVPTEMPVWNKSQVELL